jgi:hypothetical protein
VFSNSYWIAFKLAENKTWGNPEWVPQANFEERNAGLGNAERQRRQQEAFGRAGSS